MKFSCQRSVLTEGLQLVSHVTAGTTTKPILQAVKIEVSENKAILEATDLEVGVRYLLEPVEVQEKGIVVLQEGRLAELLREWPEERVCMELKGAMCHISGSGGAFKLAGYDPKEFPTIPTGGEKGAIEIEAGELVEMIRKVVFACASERVRHTMTGVLFQVEAGILRMVATDGRRLASAREKKGVSGRGPMEGIVPRKGIEQLARIAERQEGKIRLKMEETHLLAGSDRATLCAQLIEGQYPNYKEAIPANNDKRAEVDVEILAGAIRRASILTTEERRLVRLGLRKGRISVEVETPEVGEAKVDIDANYEGENLEIGFNPDFLLDTLKAIGKGPVHLEFKEATSSAVIKSGQDFIYVVMPIRLTETS